ncbi:lytic transglycosylase domain-containing protein [Paucihalobacter ruber]|uniref:Lytic transglycosylase domain-containing protein n=1 Tax=Paucihalobacter ruber TaxID=2567861 RepID=A0A506PL15_9FLAO|nr:lytic transglycosylase domain-containing protein [Paucihalobacter ruber]TPV33787.1 lytic transglycosylase domain-containing protein [Paucihalobacter ruber]
MNTLKHILAAFGAVCLISLIIIAAQSIPENDLTLTLENDPVNKYNVYAIQVPNDLNFAGEPIPLHNPDIYERMDRELLVNTYWQSNALLMFKRAEKYFPIIEPILKEHGIPDDFKYLAVIESGLTNAVSPAGARGFWQIMPATGKEFGLEINQNVDERYHLEKSTHVACKYLKQSKNKLGSWTLAAAAYNAGNGGISKQLNIQKADNYYDLLLGEETGRYIFRIIALKEIINNPTTYGFNFKPEDLYQHIPTRKIEIDTAVTDFAAFAKNFNINYKILKLHNPWLREPHLNNSSRKKYVIDIPAEGIYTAP